MTMEGHHSVTWRIVVWKDVGDRSPNGDIVPRES